MIISPELLIMSINRSFAELSLLLVEPSAMQERAIRTQLTELGVTTCRTARSGADAIEAMRSAPPSAVVSALYLPDMTGADLVFAMRNTAELVLTPFILVSSETRIQVLDPIRQSGACFIVPKPCTAQHLQRALTAAVETLAPTQLAVATEDLENLRVLLVDDSPMTRRFLRHLLESLGIEDIIEAGDGQEAVAKLAETMVDLVMTDYNMPEMDGRQLTEYIRQQSWQCSVPILMVTSESNSSRLAAVEQAGVSAICDKPMEPAEIRRLIENLVNAR